MKKLSARQKAMVPGYIFILIGIIFILRFGTIVLALTLIPSIVAFFIDHRPGRPSFKVIAACNVSSALPFIVQIIDFSLKKQYSEAGLVLDSWQSWAFIYCGAGAGWAMLFLSKYVARIVTLMQYDYAVSVLEKKQAILVAEWGEDITHIEKNQKKKIN